MRRTVIATFSAVALLSAVALALTEPLAAAASEQLVHANLVRVQIQGRWESFPMIPLSEQLCASGDALFERYCNDGVLAPSGR